MRIFIVAMVLLAAIAGQAAEKPNVLIVMTDDQGLGDFSFTGQSGAQDAELRRLRPAVGAADRFSRLPDVQPDARATC